MAARLKVKYNEEIAPALMKKFGYKSVMQIPKMDKIIVEGVNIASCHVKPRKQGEQGGIIQKEIPMYACKVMRVCPKCGKATRHAVSVVNGEKVRVCKKCGETI